MEDNKIYVQVIKCKDPNYWYSDKINENYKVTEWKSNKVENWDEVEYYIVKQDNSTLLYLDVDDCIVVTRRMKILKLKENAEHKNICTDN